jgi:hypothetical protein
MPYPRSAAGFGGRQHDLFPPVSPDGRERELCKHVRLDREALDLEWRELQRQVSLTYHQAEHKSGYSYLEAAHVFILAHVLRRPVIVLATDWVDAQGRQLAAGEEIAGELVLSLRGGEGLADLRLGAAFGVFRCVPTTGTPQGALLAGSHRAGVRVERKGGDNSQMDPDWVRPWWQLRGLPLLPPPVRGRCLTHAHASHVKVRDPP